MSGCIAKERKGDMTTQALNTTSLPHLSTRLYLDSSICATDIDEITRLLQDVVVLEDIAQVPHNYTRQDAIHLLHQLELLEQTRPDLASLKFTIRDKTNQKPVGRIDIRPDGWKMGYWLGLEHWGQGIMTWACSEALKAARQHGICKVSASPKHGNWGSRKVLERNCFRHVRDEAQYFQFHCEMFDCWIMEVNLEDRKEHK